MSPEDSPTRITADLTDPQREAVTFGEGPLLVVAGAGTGKTRVITRRIAWLLADGVPRDRVIALTFTNKAAEEMHRRVEALVGKDVYVTTFHSFCARFLRREIGGIGRDPSFTIYDRADSLRVVRRTVGEMQLDDATYSPADLLDYIGLQKDRIVGAEECVEQAVGVEEQTCAAVYQRYQEHLEQSNALDFDDLLLRTLDVFRQCPAVLQDYQWTYLHVLVDEYQDTNLPQHLMARALQGKHRNITAVGDPDQMIYSWRGARLENLLEFEEDFPGARVVKLERNYRSSANILRASSACISRNELRHEKELWTDRDGGEQVVVRQFKDPYDEGRWVARKAEELIREGVDPGEVAVFYRTKQQSLPLEDAFATLSLPHQVVDSVGFFDRRAVKDLRAYLQLMVNPLDDASCARIINTPSRGIGAKTLEKLREGAEEHRLSLLETAERAADLESLGTRATRVVSEFHDLYRKLSALETEGVCDLIKKVIELTDYVDAQPTSRREDTREIVDMLLGYAAEYDKQNPEGSLMAFLEQAALISDVDGWNSRASAVSLMTLHSAKGLEFDAVFIVGAENSLLPHRRAVEENVQGSEGAALEEERRLFYVGMTRARDRLFVTHASRRTIQGRSQSVQPSPFLCELPEDCVDRDGGSRAGGGRFAREMDRVLRRKRATLRVLGVPGEQERRLVRGAQVKHPRFGAGKVLEVVEVGARYMVRVDFESEGPMALLLTADNVSPG